jgi:hypothetical protein
MRPNATSPFATLFTNVAREEPTAFTSVSTDQTSAADAPGFDEHLVQMEFTLTPDRRRILVVVGNDQGRSETKMEG